MKNVCKPTLVKVPFSASVIQIDCGSYHTAVLTDGQGLWVCGSNAPFGQLGVALVNESFTCSLQRVKDLRKTDIRQVCCGSAHTAVLVNESWVDDQHCTSCSKSPRLRHLPVCKRHSASPSAVQGAVHAFQASAPLPRLRRHLLQLVLVAKGRHPQEGDDDAPARLRCLLLQAVALSLTSSQVSPRIPYILPNKQLYPASISLTLVHTTYR